MSSGKAAAPERAGQDGRHSVYLHPGHLFASPQPAAVTTILGSCVAVCLWDSRLGLGGANHYMLPYGAGDGPSSPRFGNVAIGKLIDELVRFGSRAPDLQAKVFGGASVMGALRQSLGEKNVQVARRLLEERGIAVAAEDVGGGRGRKLIFHSDDGAVWVKSI